MSLAFLAKLSAYKFNGNLVCKSEFSENCLGSPLRFEGIYHLLFATFESYIYTT